MPTTATKPTKPRKALRIIKSILSGIVAGVPILGDIQANIKSELPAPGQVDWVRVVSQMGTIILIIGFVLGKVSLEDLKALIPLFF